MPETVCILSPCVFYRNRVCEPAVHSLIGVFARICPGREGTSGRTLGATHGVARRLSATGLSFSMSAGALYPHLGSAPLQRSESRRPLQLTNPVARSKELRNRATWRKCIGRSANIRARAIELSFPIMCCAKSAEQRKTGRALSTAASRR